MFVQGYSRATRLRHKQLDNEFLQSPRRCHWSLLYELRQNIVYFYNPKHFASRQLLEVANFQLCGLVHPPSSISETVQRVSTVVIVYELCYQYVIGYKFHKTTSLIRKMHENCKIL